MRMKLLIVMVLVIFVTGITFPIIMINNKNISEVNLVAINEVVKIVEKNWGQINKETLNNSGFKQPFTIIDNLENIIYQTPGTQFNNIYDAIKKRDLIVDVMQNDVVVGKIIIHTNEQEIVQKMKKELITSFI